MDTSYRQPREEYLAGSDRMGIGPFGLYLHFPFCPYKCTYCDFYKLIFNQQRQAAFFDALAVETELAATAYAETGLRIATIFVGGGTPSMLNIDRFAAWLEQVKQLFTVPVGLEFSFECNPDSVSVDLFQALKDLGVTRPTVGIQSFQPELLAPLGRPHQPADSQRAIYLANAIGFYSFGVDLIFGLPNQTTAQLSVDLDQLVDLRPPHISYYQLTVEPETPMERHVAEGRFRLPDESLSLAMYQAGVERFQEAGYTRYEVSSFSLTGHQCRHNLGYWRGRDYLGLGPSAHSFMRGRRYANVADLDAYIDALTKGKRPLAVDESGHLERMTEALMLGLRTSRGIRREEFQRRFGLPVDSRIDLDQQAVLVDAGYLTVSDSALRLTDLGMAMADEVTRRLLR